MNADPCQAFESRIHQLLDARSDLAADGPLQDHAARCAACRHLWLDYQWLSRKLTSTWLPVSRSAFRKTTTRSRAGWFAAIAASLLLVATALSAHWISGQLAGPRIAADTSSVEQAPNGRPSQRITLDTPSAPHARPDAGQPNVDPKQIFASIEAIPDQLEAISPYWLYAPPLAGVVSWTSSLNVTLDFLRRQLEQPKSSPPVQPGMGWDRADGIGSRIA